MYAWTKARIVFPPSAMLSTSVSVDQGLRAGVGESCCCDAMTVVKRCQKRVYFAQQSLEKEAKLVKETQRLARPLEGTLSTRETGRIAQEGGPMAGATGRIDQEESLRETDRTTEGTRKPTTQPH